MSNSCKKLAVLSCTCDRKLLVLHDLQHVESVVNSVGSPDTDSKVYIISEGRLTHK